MPGTLELMGHMPVTAITLGPTSQDQTWVPSVTAGHLGTGRSRASVLNRERDCSNPAQPDPSATAPVRHP